MTGPFQRAPTLSTQMMFNFIGVILLTAVAAWIPEVWLIQDHIEEEAWARVEQGRRGADALYGSWENEVANAAILAAQLPTLHALVATGETERLTDYLFTVEISLDLDMLLVCNVEGEVVAQIGAALDGQVCDWQSDSGFFVNQREEPAEGWLLASRPVRLEGTALGSVVAGVQLDDEFAQQMRSETGLEHTLLVSGEAVAASFPEGRAYTSSLSELEKIGDGAGSDRSKFSRQGQPYYATRFSLGETALAAELALEAGEIAETRRRLIQTGTISIVLIILFGSVVGILSARRISRPLKRLAAEAARFGKGDLYSPITVKAPVQELNLVAHTLEQARVDFRQTLDELHREKVWVEHLLDAIVEGIVTLDDKERITFFSQGAERITGWQQEEVLGQHCDTLFQLVHTGKSFSETIPAPGQRRKIWVRLPHGEAALSITHAELAPPGTGATGAVLVFRDVSEEEAVQRLLGHFLANVTHEFRTPLTALGASVELLMDQSAEATKEELDPMLSWLYLGIVSLQTLVDNLLESASLEAGRFQVSPHPADISEIVAEAVRFVQPLLEKYGQRLILDIPPSLPDVRADSRRTVQVLVNLLSNANKYAPEGSEIILRVQRVEKRVRVSVEDQGPGVAVDVQSILFQRFSHFIEDETGDSRKYGVGLGLWVVKAIVEAHGGEVGVEERPSGGSSFWFTLPVMEDG